MQCFAFEVRLPGVVAVDLGVELKCETLGTAPVPCKAKDWCLQHRPRAFVVPSLKSMQISYLRDDAGTHGCSLVEDMIAHKPEAAYIKSAWRLPWTVPDRMYTRL